MNLRPNTLSAPGPFAAWEELWSRFDARDSRTVPRRSLAGIAPSLIAVLSMSVVTVVMIVLIVITVANADWVIQSQNDVWSRWSWSPAVRYGRNGEVPAGYAAMIEEQDAETASEEFHANAESFVPEP